MEKRNERGAGRKPIFTEEQTEALSREFLFERNGKTEDNKNVIRFCTSWATKEEHVEHFIHTVKAMLQ